MTTFEDVKMSKNKDEIKSEIINILRMDLYFVLPLCCADFKSRRDIAEKLYALGYRKEKKEVKQKEQV